MIIKKMAQIREEKKFDNIMSYDLLELNSGIRYYEQGLEALKALIKAYPDCLEEEAIEKTLNQAKEMGRRANKSPNSYSHYQDEFFVEGVKYRNYIKIGSFRMNPQSAMDLRNVPIRLYNYGINGSYANRTIVDLKYDRYDDQLECIGISHTEPYSTLHTSFMTEVQIKFSEIGSVKLKSMTRGN